MKTRWGLRAIVLALVAPLAAQTVTVTSPNGGEEWHLGTPHAITWSFQNPGATKVNLILRQGGGVVGTIKSNVDLSAGSWVWTSAGTLENGTVAAPGSGYIVRIRDAGNTFGDNSDGGFTLAAGAPALQLTAPNGGETWTAGSPRSITWTAANWSGTVQLNLYQGGAFKGIIASGVPSAPGAFSWKAGETDRGSFVGGGFKVKILRSYPGASLPKTPLAEDSDSPFAIAGGKAGGGEGQTAPVAFVPPPVRVSGDRIIPKWNYLDPETGNVLDESADLSQVWSIDWSLSGNENAQGQPEYIVRGRWPMRSKRMGVNADISYLTIVKAKITDHFYYTEAEIPIGTVIGYSTKEGRLGALKVLDIGQDLTHDGKYLRVHFVTYEKPAGGE